VKRKSSAIPISPGSKLGPGGKATTPGCRETQGRRAAADGAGAGAFVHPFQRILVKAHIRA
jgi:hypothetical protein